MELKIANIKKEIELADDVFACEFNEPLVHQVVTAYMASWSCWNKSTKNTCRSQRRWCKTLEAKRYWSCSCRYNSKSNLAKGGVTFAAKPRCFKQKVNKKMYRGAIRSILSELIRQED